MKITIKSVQSKPSVCVLPNVSNLRDAVAKAKVKFKAMAAASAVLAMLASCSVNDGINQGPGDGQVRFTTDIGEVAAPQSAYGSRASGTDWTQGDKVGIFMVGNGSVTPLAGAYNKPYEVTNTTTGELSPVDGTHLYYPTTGSVDFFAYYPYQSGMVGYLYLVNVSDQSDPEKIDLLRAFADGTARSGYDKTHSAPVALGFHHRLSKFIIETEAGDGVADLTGMNVTIKGMNTKVGYDIALNSFEASTSAASFAPAAILDGGQYEAIVIPAISAAGQWSVEFEVGGETYTWNIPATEFESGKEHTWTVTVQKIPAAVQGTINDWGTGSGGTGVAE